MTGCLSSPSMSLFCLFLRPCSVHVTHAFLLQKNTTQSPSPPICSTLYHPAAGGAVLADLHWLLRAVLYPWHAHKHTQKKNHSPSPSSNQHLPDCGPREPPSVSILPFLLLFSPRQITAMSQTVRREWWSAIRPPFPITHWTHTVMPLNVRCGSQSYPSCTSVTDTVLTLQNTTPWSITDTGHHVYPHTPTPPS